MNTMTREIKRLYLVTSATPFEIIRHGCITKRGKNNIVLLDYYPGPINSHKETDFNYIYTVDAESMRKDGIDIVQNINNKHMYFVEENVGLKYILRKDV